MKNKTYAPYLITIPFIGYYLYQKRHYLLGKKYREKIINNSFRNRFNNKYTTIKQKSDTCLLGVISPSNVYDFQKVLYYANHYKIPIISDINYSQSIIPYQHIKLSLEKYQNVIEISEKEKFIRVESGIKIKELLEYLNSKGYTIKELEEYSESSLTVNDVLFNNYYGWNVKNCIEEYYVITPKEEKIFNFRHFCDFTKNHINFSDIFINSSNLLGIILDIKLAITPIERYHYLKLKIPKKLNINEALATFSKDKLVDDVIISINQYNTDNIELYAKINEDTFIKKIALLSQDGIAYENITQSQYIENTTIPTNDMFSLRKIKILINNNSKKELFINKINKIMKESSDIVPNIKISTKTELIEISFPIEEDIKLIEKEYYTIREIYKAVNKLNGNFYLNNNIILNTKYDLMREIGYNNYFIDEDIKHKFDPNYVLNPHLCFPKPKFFEFLKRQSRIWNYLFTKVKI